MAISILNIGGHPKDAILYAGGTMAKHIINGDRVCTLTPTHGLSHHGRAIDEYKSTGKADIGSLIEERKQELIEAAAELGVTDVRFLGYDDEIVLPKEEIIRDIADVIGEIRPDIIITHWPEDTVAAHGNATKMTFLAMEAASGIRADRPYAPHSPKQVFFHATQGRTNLGENARPTNPTTVIDITDVIHQKANAMNRFVSQFYGENSPLQRKLGEAMDGSQHAIHMKVPYAESFIAFNPELYQLLPLSEYGIEISKKSEPEGYEYLTQMLLDPD